MSQNRVITVPSKKDEDAMNRFYSEETKALCASIGEEEMQRLLKYEFIEIDGSFVAFIENYADLSNLPKDMTIIDIGSYMSFQGDYFKSHEAYIGVEPSVPFEYRLKQDNASYYEMSGQKFIQEVLPKLIEDGLDLDRTFCVSSAVPDKELRKMIEETFPYHRIAYPAEVTRERYTFDTPDTVNRQAEDAVQKVQFKIKNPFEKGDE